MILLGSTKSGRSTWNPHNLFYLQDLAGCKPDITLKRTGTSQIVQYKKGLGFEKLHLFDQISIFGWRVWGAE